VVITDLRNL